MSSQRAVVGRVPYMSGYGRDGLVHGGDVVLTIGGKSLLMGLGDADFALAQKIADLWNAAVADTAAEGGAA